MRTQPWLMAGLGALIAVFLIGATLLGAGWASTAREDEPSACSAPALPGTVVRVTLDNMASMRAKPSGMMMGRHGSITIDRDSAAVGRVSFLVTNAGSRIHELVVLPLAVGQDAGVRPVNSESRADESASMGEASRNCGRGEGDGILAGSRGWVTLTLPRGRYELVCNLPGHYQAGMYTILTVG